MKMGKAVSGGITEMWMGKLLKMGYGTICLRLLQDDFRGVA